MPKKRRQLLIVLLWCLGSFLIAEQLPKMAIVVDDLGYSLEQCQRLVSSNYMLNLSVIPGLAYSQKCARLIEPTPHQLLIHLPWLSHRQLGRRKKYPIYVSLDMTSTEMAEMLTKAFLRVPQARGLNNHMGSRFSADSSAVAKFMQVYGKYKASKYFLDSNTIRQTVAEKQARALGIPTAKNEAFLDGRQTRAYIEGEFLQALKMAETKGTVIAICHGNRKVTLEALPTIMKKYSSLVDYVTVTDIIEEREKKQ